MKTQLNLFAAALFLASAGTALAAVRYVDVNSTNSMWPYTSWATAASGIQEAINFAEAGDEIVVTNGTYSVGGHSTIGQPTTTNREQLWTLTEARVVISHYRCEYNQLRPPSRLGYQSPAQFAEQLGPSPAPVGLRPPSAGDGQQQTENVKLTKGSD